MQFCVGNILETQSVITDVEITDNSIDVKTHNLEMTVLIKDIFLKLAGVSFL